MKLLLLLGLGVLVLGSSQDRGILTSELAPFVPGIRKLTYDESLFCSNCTLYMGAVALLPARNGGYGSYKHVICGEFHLRDVPVPFFLHLITNIGDCWRGYRPRKWTTANAQLFRDSEIYWHEAFLRHPFLMDPKVERLLPELILTNTWTTMTRGWNVTKEDLASKVALYSPRNPVMETVMDAVGAIVRMG